MQEEIQAYYNTTVVPASQIMSAKMTLDQFIHAYTLVSSRAFLVDAYHGLAMVPIADAFNHAADNHVHLEVRLSLSFRLHR